jgi:hypothetical protein
MKNKQPAKSTKGFPILLEIWKGIHSRRRGDKRD